MATSVIGSGVGRGRGQPDSMTLKRTTVIRNVQLFSSAVVFMTETGMRRAHLGSGRVLYVPLFYVVLSVRLLVPRRITPAKNPKSLPDVVSCSQE